jgi:uncharacterized membrane protein YfcA
VRRCAAFAVLPGRLSYSAEMVDPLLLASMFLGAAILYSSVGHAGASAYLAAMGLLGIAPDVARPTALALNIVVASFVTFRFWRRGYISWRALLPFLVGSVPFAFLGGSLPISGALYKQLVGAVLIVAAVQLFRTARLAAQKDTGHMTPRVPTVPAIGIGGAIGFLSGLTGTGGGIFLSPVLLIASWAETRAASGMAAGFILANSISGLAGNLARLASLPPALPLWIVAVVVGAVIGSEIGTRRAPTFRLREALSVVLVIAGLKLIFIG